MALELMGTLGVFALVTCVKILLIPSYHSTDFEVHRNWLALTHTLPMSKWYTEATSIWTLDYPPFFAHFEYLLSLAARVYTPDSLVVQEQPYFTQKTLFFQRATVMFTDLVLLFGVLRYAATYSQPKKLALAVFVLCNVGLLFVDHIHFQYNGFLFGILLLALAFMQERNYLVGALFFAALLNFKHIFLYIAPAVTVHLFRAYCLPGSSISLQTFVRLGMLGAIVLGVFVASFGPFVAMGQLEQVVSRLFPFKRGLCHAYWAPNFWALYNVVDKAATVALQRFSLLPSSAAAQKAVLTGGLVTDQEMHVVLPEITPLITMILALVFMVPAVVAAWRQVSHVGLVRSLVLCAFASFLFGWHVHEKAALLFILPMSLCALDGAREARAFFLTSVAGHFSLFPLLFETRETPTKILLMLAYTSLSYILLERCLTGKERSRFSFSVLEKLYLCGFFLLQAYTSSHTWILGDRLPFLPLLLTSLYCAVGVVYGYALFLVLSFTSSASAPALVQSKTKAQ